MIYMQPHHVRPRAAGQPWTGGAECTENIARCAFGYMRLNLGEAARWMCVCVEVVREAAAAAVVHIVFEEVVE